MIALHVLLAAILGCTATPAPVDATPPKTSSSNCRFDEGFWGEPDREQGREQEGFWLHRLEWLCPEPEHQPTLDAFGYSLHHRGSSPIRDESVARGRAAITERCGGTLPPEHGAPPPTCAVPDWIVAAGGWSHQQVAAAMMYDLVRKTAPDQWARHYALWLMNPLPHNAPWHAGRMPLTSAEAAITSRVVDRIYGVTGVVIGHRTPDRVVSLLPHPYDIDLYEPKNRTGVPAPVPDFALITDVGTTTTLGELQPYAEAYERVHYLVAYQPAGGDEAKRLTPGTLVGVHNAPSQSSLRWFNRDLDESMRATRRLMRLTPSTLQVKSVDDRVLATLDLDEPTSGLKLRTQLCEVEGEPHVVVLATPDVTLKRLTTLYEALVSPQAPTPDEPCVLEHRSSAVVLYP